MSELGLRPVSQSTPSAGAAPRTRVLQPLCALLVGCAVALATAPSTANGAAVGKPEVSGTIAEELSAASAEEPLLTFVSIPDLFNTDVGDISHIRGPGRAGWDPGDGNSMTRSWKTGVSKIFRGIAAEDPDFVLVAGDLVQGRWHVDHDNVQIFGSPTNLTSAKEAVRLAGRAYYQKWKRRFRRRGLPVYAAVGDHEVGDLPPIPGSGLQPALIPTYKQTWAKHFTRRAGSFRFRRRPRGTPFEATAYAIRRGPVMVVTVDVFFQRADGSVGVGVGGGQLRWLRKVLRRANANPGIHYTIVQGHTPVLTPVRSRASSNLTMPGGRNSALWRVLREQRVDLYLAGEVHHMTATNADGVEQVAHGSLVAFNSDSNYLLGRVYRDRLVLKLKRTRIEHSGSRRMWQTSLGGRPQVRLDVDGRYRVVGTLQIDRRGRESHRTGYFEPYRP